MSVNSVEAVLFDCDGVLVDSEAISKNVLVELSTSLGADLDPDIATERFKGRRMADCLREVERTMSQPLPDGFMQTFRQAEYRALAQQVTVIDGVIEMIESLQVPICVASNGPLEKIRCTLGATGIDRYFDDNLLSAYDANVFKPDPDLYLLAAQKLGVNPAGCVVMEDSIPGTTAGVAAGMRTIAFTPGVDRSGYPTENTFFVDSMAQAAALISEWS